MMTELENDELNLRINKFFGDRMFSTSVTAAIFQFLNDREMTQGLQKKTGKKTDGLFPEGVHPTKIMPSELSMAFYDSVNEHTKKLLAE